MPEFFLELFSEEIPARMQEAAAEKLQNALIPTLEDFDLKGIRSFYGPRRIAIVATIGAKHKEKIKEVRGPKEGAPEPALTGFLRKYLAQRGDLVIEGGHYILRWKDIGFTAEPEIASAMRFLFLQRFSWPKSMRWGQGGEFSWIRPLRRIVCLLDGEVVPVVLGPVTASNETEGHRVLAPGAFSVSSAKDWEERLQKHYVYADAAVRNRVIWLSLQEKAKALELAVIEDQALADEVTGLVEWPVPMIGKIDADFMSLPPEVRELSMKVNQKYFALRDAEGRPAPYFAFVANLETPDGGASIIAGNERVLRARLADARHFWNFDLKTRLNELLPKLEQITYHTKIGTQRERAERIAILAKQIALKFKNELTLNDIEDAEWAGRLSKTDLVTTMVAEFPELQGVIGGYYASENGWSKNVSLAIRSHYQPKGPSDDVPTGIIPCSVALADKIDTLVQFFKIDELPTGSGDPYALRRAAVGIARIILENKLSFSLEGIIQDENVYDFIVERLRTKLRAEGKRHDVLSAVFASGQTKNLLHLMNIVDALSSFLIQKDGLDFLLAYRRASNILKVEDVKDGLSRSGPNAELYVETAEKNLATALDFLVPLVVSELKNARYGEAMRYLSNIRPFVDDFFLKVTVNATESDLRLNRLRLLAQLRDTMHQIADFSKIES